MVCSFLVFSTVKPHTDPHVVDLLKAVLMVENSRLLSPLIVTFWRWIMLCSTVAFLQTVDGMVISCLNILLQRPSSSYVSRSYFTFFFAPRR